MKPLKIEDVQHRSLKILVYLDKICRANNLKYTIFYGTLVGLERHQGFIPWDDDIDLVMLRPDYEKLVSILATDSHYQLLSFNNREHFRYPFAKLVDKETTLISNQIYNIEDPLMGVFVDIFPLDGIPETQKEQKEFHDICEQYRLNMMDTTGNKSYARSFSKWKGLVKRVVRYPHYRKVLKEGDDNYWRHQYQVATIKYPIKSAKYCGYLEYIDRNWGVFPTAWFADDQYEDVQFAGHQIMAIKQRKAFLKLRFGDYMKLPPKSEQVTHHPYTFYRK